MKNIIFILVVSLSLTYCNCKENNKENETKTNTIERKTELNTTETFNEFYSRFTKDSIFQLERIEFPLQGKYMDSELAGLAEANNKTWTKENWIMIHSISTEDLKNIEVKKDITDSVVIIESKGKDFGFYFKEKYINKNGKWYLVYLEDILI